MGIEPTRIHLGQVFLSPAIIFYHNNVSLSRFFAIRKEVFMGIYEFSMLPLIYQIFIDLGIIFLGSIISLGFVKFYLFLKAMSRV